MDVGVGLNQDFYHAKMPRKGCLKERRFAGIIAGVGIRAVQQQGRCRGGMTAVGGNDQWRPAEFVLRLEVGALVDQEFCDLG